MARTIGLLGGGQLGQMLCDSARRENIKVIVLDAEKSPAKQVRRLFLAVNDIIPVLRNNMATLLTQSTGQLEGGTHKWIFYRSRQDS